MQVDSSDGWKSRCHDKTKLFPGILITIKIPRIAQRQKLKMKLVRPQKQTYHRITKLCAMQGFSAQLCLMSTVVEGKVIIVGCSLRMAWPFICEGGDQGDKTANRENSGFKGSGGVLKS